MAQPATTTSTTPYPFEFTGSGFEYFRIWIVNVLLTIVTFGIYSAWAKVRTKRYFYRNTHVAGSEFEYHARPLQILKGRALVFGGYIVFLLSAQLHPWISIILVVVFFVVTPWLIVRAHLFTARNSSWRGIRFDFNRQSMADAFKTFLGVPLLIPFTLGLLIPYFSFRGWRFAVSNSRLGRQPFAFASARVGAYYRAFFAMALLVVVIVIVFGGLIALVLLLFAPGAFAAGAERTGGVGLLSLLPLLLMAVLYLVAVPGYRVMTRNVSLNGTTLGGHTFDSTLKVWPVVWIYASNAACIIFSVGLLTPWARVRVARYLANHLVLHATGDLASFIQAESKRAGAFGEEAADFMDIDVGGI